MSELTKEYFEQALTGLASKADLQALATNAALAAAEQRVVKRIDEAQEELARMVAAGFEDVQRRLDVTEQVKSFECKFQRLEEALLQPDVRRSPEQMAALLAEDFVEFGKSSRRYGKADLLDIAAQSAEMSDLAPQLVL